MEHRFTYWIDLPSGWTFPISLALENYLIEDIGIGSYEYWGARGFDSRLAVTEHEFDIIWTESDSRILQHLSPDQILSRVLEDDNFLEAVETKILLEKF